MGEFLGVRGGLDSLERLHVLRADFETKCFWFFFQKFVNYPPMKGCSESVLLSLPKSAAISEQFYLKFQIFKTPKNLDKIDKFPNKILDSRRTEYLHFLGNFGGKTGKNSERNK